MILERLISFQGRPGPVLLVIADGVGLAEPGAANALSLAHTPNIDRLLASPMSTKLNAHGEWVGLPSNSDMGNSEVGHNTLGGGRIFDQGAKLVDSAIDSGSLFESDVWKTVRERGLAGGTVHFIGLVSDGNVHSNIRHLLRILDQSHDAGIRSVCVHALLDGRDVDPRSAPQYLRILQSKLDQINQTADAGYRIASGGGRMRITMDRYQADWNMVHRGFNAHVHGCVDETGHLVTDAIDEVERQYATDPGITDQYLAPFVVTGNGQPVGKMQDGDAVVLFNFRGDRAMEISSALDDAKFEHFERGNFPDIYFCGMLQYDGDLKIPRNYLVQPPVIERTMGEYLCAKKVPSFAVSETQKFGHVTYFWNGNRSGYIDETLETYIEIPSDNLPFDQAPDMKSREITDATIELLISGKYRFGRINFANGDMVGHTGNIEATVQSLESVDACLGRLLEAVDALKGVLVFTADHGNAEEMFTEREGKRMPKTSHSLNPVPFVIADSSNDYAYGLQSGVEGGLANVAATLFNLLGFRAPHDYEASLIHFPKEPLRRTLYSGRVASLGLESFKPSEDDAEWVTMEIIRHPGSAVIAAVDRQNRVCLIRQYRPAASDWIWELPAGGIEFPETPDETARRELQEETGYSADQWEMLGSFYTSPGYSDEYMHAYKASHLHAGEQSLEAHEILEPHWLEIEKIEDMIRRGEIIDAKTITTMFLMASGKD
ncbi:MAG: 2,3-bisphosphoglycerate-independent phosphoglycerate mutase [Gammaproteobacteria bacterium]|nr:2,3-bisphosphoglycerate-independent phosphoglycerate mutase [Gammaproteobacteria bacterium]